jgi:hypothetical protein
MCAFCVYLYLIVKKFSVQSRGIFVIMKNFQPLYAKSFDLESNFNWVKGSLANMQVIMILAALLHFSPKL